MIAEFCLPWVFSPRVVTKCSSIPALAIDQTIHVVIPSVLEFLTLSFQLAIIDDSNGSNFTDYQHQNNFEDLLNAYSWTPITYIRMP